MRAGAQINHCGSDESTAAVGVAGGWGVEWGGQAWEEGPRESVLKYFCLVNTFDAWYFTTNLISWRIFKRICSNNLLIHILWLLIGQAVHFRNLLYGRVFICRAFSLLIQ